MGCLLAAMSGVELLGPCTNIREQSTALETKVSGKCWNRDVLPKKRLLIVVCLGWFSLGFVTLLNLVFESLFSNLSTGKSTFYSLNTNGDACANLKYEELEPWDEHRDDVEG